MRIRMAGRRALGSPKRSVEPALFNHNPLLQRIFLYAAGHWPYIVELRF